MLYPLSYGGVGFFIAARAGNFTRLISESGADTKVRLACLRPGDSAAVSPKEKHGTATRLIHFRVVVSCLSSRAAVKNEILTARSISHTGADRQSTESLVGCRQFPATTLACQWPASRQSPSSSRFGQR